MGRTGRRPGGSGSREAILDAAQAVFADRGYDGGTMREIAQRAGVDPALVHHFHGTKEQLFAAAMRLPVDPAVAIPALLQPGTAGLGERLVRYFLGLCELGGEGSPFLALLRGAASHERSAAMLREFITRVVLGRIAASLDAPQAELRATLAGSQMVGLAMVRYVVRVEPLASADHDTVVAAVAPTVQRYLTGDIS
ncbi:MAG: TetR family transcriptional regulator [Candidatus Dormibacteria bacterium]